jgi:plasmid stabilization system protein ParE
MISVRFHPQADEELLEATEWYVERSVTAAEGFVRDIAPRESVSYLPA